jgi:hypothetical protein
LRGASRTIRSRVDVGRSCPLDDTLMNRASGFSGSMSRVRIGESGSPTDMSPFVIDMMPLHPAATPS